MGRPRNATGIQLGERMARSLILQGAAFVLAEHGVRAASVELLLEASGVSRRTFYRLYQNKEDVMMALYRFGTDGLIAAFELAIREETEPLRVLERCIDVHLRNAQQLGRIVYVLGGEALRLESPLHARRLEVQEAVVALMVQNAPTHAGKPIDPLLFRGIIVAVEGVTRIMLQQCDEGRRVTDDAVERVRVVLRRMASAAIAGDGPGVTAMPADTG